MERFVVTMFISAPDRAAAEEAVAQMVSDKTDVDVGVENWIVDDDCDETRRE